MKKFAKVIVFILFMATVFSALKVYGEMPLRILVNNDRLFFPDAQPFIDSNGRTQTPARFIGEKLGATVTWDGTTQKATFVKDSKKLILYAGKKEYELDGKKLQMDTAAILQEGRTFVPARYVAEAFGAIVSWDSVIKTVYISTDGTTVPSPQGTKDPITGWIKVTSDETYVEYAISITFDPDSSLLNSRYDAAEKMFAERYGEAIAKEVFGYLRQKQSREAELPKKQYKLGNKLITAEGYGISIMLKVWREGVALQ